MKQSNSDQELHDNDENDIEGEDDHSMVDTEDSFEQSRRLEEMEYDDKEAKIIENLDDGDAEEPTLHYYLAEAKGM